MSIRRIRSALKEDRYAYSIHALEEMDEDHLADSDVYEAIMKGRVVAKLTGDPRGDALRGSRAGGGQRI